MNNSTEVLKSLTLFIIKLVVTSNNYLVPIGETKAPKYHKCYQCYGDSLSHLLDLLTVHNHTIIS